MLSAQEDPVIDAVDLLRRISMKLVESGHDRLGGRMLDTLRPQMAESADIDATIALAELARGDVQQARERLEQDVLSTQPSHALSLLVKAACDRADGQANWRRGLQTVLSTSSHPQWRQAAQDMLSH